MLFAAVHGSVTPLRLHRISEGVYLIVIKYSIDDSFEFCRFEITALRDMKKVKGWGSTINLNPHPSYGYPNILRRSTSYELGGRKVGSNTRHMHHRLS